MFKKFELQNADIYAPEHLMKKGSDGQVVKVSASQSRDGGFEPYTATMFPHMTLVLVSSRKQTHD